MAKKQKWITGWSNGALPPGIEVLMDLGLEAGAAEKHSRSKAELITQDGLTAAAFMAAALTSPEWAMGIFHILEDSFLSFDWREAGGRLVAAHPLEVRNATDD